ncbi:MAG: radical SAM protein [Candidatus Omnitrophota bacterium]
MGYKRILLVQAKYDSIFSNVLPAGIGCLSELLSSKGIENDVFDLNVRTNTEQKLREKITNFKPDMVGFSMMSLNYLYNYGVIRRIKKSFPDLKAAAGGAHVSTVRDEVLKKCDAIDYGVVLEGEETLMELISGQKDLHEIKGLIHREDGNVVYNGDRPFIQDLDSLPYPKYLKFKKKDYMSLVSIFSSRGCPFECIYCPVKLAIGKRFVARSPKNVVDEIEYHYRQGHREFSMRDDNFTLMKERVYEFCDEIEKRNFKDIYLMCDNGVRADRLDYNILKRMRQVGFKMLGVGVESGDDKILKNLKKSATVKDMEEAIRMACELDYMVEIFLLIGSPGETWHEFEKSVKLAMKYPIMTASFYHLLPYPNTELFDYAKAHGYLLREPEAYLNDGSQRVNTPFLSTPDFPYELRKKAFSYAYKTTSRFTRKNRRAYSNKHLYAKLRKMGVGAATAAFLAGVYTNAFLYEYVFNNKMLTDIKLSIKKFLSLNKNKAV